MKIAMVSEHASPLAVLGGVDAGGQNVHVAAFAAELARLGHSVTVYTRRDDPDAPVRVALAPGVVVEHVPAGPPRAIPNAIDRMLPYMGAFSQYLARAWRRDRPDLVHSHFWMSGLAALDAAQPLSVPVAQTFHALGVVKRRHQGVKDTSPPERIPTERRIVAEADLLVAQCSDEVFELIRLGADQRRIAVISSGVDVSRFSPDGPAEERRSRRPRLLVVSRFVERKGIGNVIAALVGLPEVELVVAGGPEREHLLDDVEGRRLMTLAENIGVADRVDFRGRVDQQHLPALYRSADVVVCAPWYEPFGIVPLEAMASGVPVVAATVGGLIDTVVHRGTGLHVPPRDPAAIAAAVRELLADRELRASLGAAGAARARGRYSWRRTGRALSEAYATVVEAHSAEHLARRALT